MKLTRKRMIALALSVAALGYWAVSSINFSGIEIGSIKKIGPSPVWSVSGSESSTYVTLSITDDLYRPCSRIKRPELEIGPSQIATLHISTSSPLLFGSTDMFKCSFTVSIPKAALEGVNEVRVYNEDLEGYTSNLDSGAQLSYKRG